MKAEPCSGLRVLDFGQGRGAIAGMILADFGADVIRIERPGGGPFRDMPAYWQWNRGKRAMTVDLRDPANRSVVLHLASTADVLVENFRPGVLDRLGLGPDATAAVNPRLIRLSVTGFDGHSRYRDVKGYEGIVAAATGQFVIQNGYRDDGPIYDAIAKGSFGAVMAGLIAVLAALRAREFTGEGQRVASSLVQGNFVYSYGGIRGDSPERTRQLGSMVQGRDPHNTMPGYRIAECADGRWIQSGSAGGRIFDNLMRALGIDMYFTDERFAGGPAGLSAADRDELIAAIDAAYRTRTLAEWIERLDENDAAYGLFMSTQEFMDHEQVIHNGHVVDVVDPDKGPMRQIGPIARFSGADWGPPGHAPRPRDGDIADPPGWQQSAPPSAETRSRPDLSRGPLGGLTILDLATFAATPGGPGLLADLGARVIKVESLEGDPMSAGAVAAMELWNRINRSKERLAVDLKTARGQQLLHQLVARGDVVVHNFRPGVPERLGVDFATLRKHNDQLVYVYGASFGSTGPDARRPAFDAVMSAMAGGEVLQAGRGNPPQQRQTTDHSAILGVAVAILLGLRERDRTGQAQDIETTMLCSAAYLLSDDFIRYEGKPARAEPDPDQLGLSPRYRLYRTGGDGWVFLACPGDHEWERFCGEVSRPGWSDDPRFGDPDDPDAAALLDSVFATDTAQRWEQRLLACDVACVVADGTWVDFLFDKDAGFPDHFLTAYDTASHGRVEQCGLAFDLDGTPGSIGSIQEFAQSTAPILRELGFDDDAIDELEADGVIRVRATGDGS